MMETVNVTPYGLSEENPNRSRDLLRVRVAEMTMTDAAFEQADNMQELLRMVGGSDALASAVHKYLASMMSGLCQDEKDVIFDDVCELCKRIDMVITKRQGAGEELVRAVAGRPPVGSVFSGI
jgi:hypothetical protein